MGLDLMELQRKNGDARLHAVCVADYFAMSEDELDLHCGCAIRDGDDDSLSC